MPPTRCANEIGHAAVPPDERKDHASRFSEQEDADIARELREAGYCPRITRKDANKNFLSFAPFRVIRVFSWEKLFLPFRVHCAIARILPANYAKGRE